MATPKNRFASLHRDPWLRSRCGLSGGGGAGVFPRKRLVDGEELARHSTLEARTCADSRDWSCTGSSWRRRGPGRRPLERRGAARRADRQLRQAGRRGRVVAGGLRLCLGSFRQQTPTPKIMLTIAVAAMIGGPHPVLRVACLGRASSCRTMDTGDSVGPDWNRDHGGRPNRAGFPLCQLRGGSIGAE